MNYDKNAICTDFWKKVRLKIQQNEENNEKRAKIN